MCRPYFCDAQRKQRATCRDEGCTCNSPQWVGDGLQCVCGNGYRRANALSCDRGANGLGCADAFNCSEIDECASQQHNCSSSETCVNMPGSFRCVTNCDGGESCNNGGSTESSSISTPILVLATAGGIAGLLALACVSYRRISKCKNR